MTYLILNDHFNLFFNIKVSLFNDSFLNKNNNKNNKLIFQYQFAFVTERRGRSANDLKRRRADCIPLGE